MSDENQPDPLLPVSTWLQPAKREGGRFLNPLPTTVGGLSLILKVLPDYLRGRAERDPHVPPGPFVTDATVYRQAPASGLRVTWFGHSSSLLEIEGFRVLLDPVWDERASPAQFFGPKRFFAPTLALQALPPIDAVLISHDHYDHLGAGTIRQLARLPALADAQWITSLGVGRRLAGFGVAADRIQELDWTQSVDVRRPDGSRLRVTSYPARHFSGRGLFDRFKTLWASFALAGSAHRVYFGADSGTWDGFADIAARHGGFDLTMLEIGAYHPLWAAIHLGPRAAADAFQAMRQPGRAGLFMPIHWGLFNLALHGWREPIAETEQICRSEDIPLWSPEPGLPTEVEAPLLADWWRDPSH